MNNAHKIHSDYDKPYCWQYYIRLQNLEEDTFWSMLSDEEMMEIENDSPMDDFETNALSDIEATINDAQSDADSSVELQTY